MPVYTKPRFGIYLHSFFGSPSFLGILFVPLLLSSLETIMFYPLLSTEMNSFINEE